MAGAEVALGADSIACERKEASPSSKETEPQVPEVLEGMTAASAEASVTQVSLDQKRKLVDMEPDEKNESPAKKQHIDDSYSISENPVPAEDEEAVSEVAKQDIEGEESEGSGHPETEKPVPVVDASPLGGALDCSFTDGNVGEEHPGHVGAIDDTGLERVKLDAESVGNGQIPFTENVQRASADSIQRPASSALHHDILPHSEQQASLDLPTSRTVEVPNNKVGVLIGKSGDTIRFLQLNSGAKIQITRDGDNDPHSSTRLVELTGTLESINKAEQLIKDVIAEANAGGSPALVARGFNTPQSGGEIIEMQIPSDKVGMLIGKGGENIRNLQTKTGARIQLLPQNVSNGDASKERMVRITGNMKQVESARELIKDVTNQVPMRLSSHSNTYSQHSFRPPRGTAPGAEWGPRSSNPTHQTGYNYQQRGMYPPQTSQYSQSHGSSYSQQQPTPRGWEQQRPAVATMQTASPSAGYGYYNQAGPSPTTPSNPLPGPISSTPAPMSYNYGHQAPYSQLPTAQQNYGHGYSEPTMYSQHQPMGSQPVVYAKSSYSAPNEAPPSYGPPCGPQPGGSMYQGPPSSQYPSSMPMQQPYPYGSSAPVQQTPPYTQAYSGNSEGYQQQTSATYSQQGGQPVPGYGHGGQPVPGYGQGGQPVPGYGQPVPQSGGYTQYPQSQPSYADTTQANVNYGYLGGATDAGGYAGNAPSSGYAAPQLASSQPSYSQPQPNPMGYYDQSMAPQTGYGVATAAAGYGKSASPQPGYGQYDATQMYGPQ